MNTIVVGVDGSSGARRALDFALEEAKLRGAAVRAVTAYPDPSTTYAGAFIVPSPLKESDFAAAARHAAEEALAAANGKRDGVDVEIVIRKGNAARVLCDESADAAMLVVGSRGRGGFAGLLVGSVSHHCALHAACPVTIVPQE